jgi:hypothetical protein
MPLTTTHDKRLTVYYNNAAQQWIQNQIVPLNDVFCVHHVRFITRCKMSPTKLAA